MNQLLNAISVTEDNLYHRMRFSLKYSSKQCTGIYPVQLVGGQWPPSPNTSAQIRPVHKPPVRLLTCHTGQGKDRRPPPRRAHGCRRQYHRPLADGE